MAYDKQTWIDGTTPVDAERMNHIEDGVGGVADDIDDVVSKLTRSSITLTSDDLMDTENFIAGSNFNIYVRKSGYVVTITFNCQGRLAKSGSAVNIVTLPDGYRPYSTSVLHTYTTQAGGYYLLQINTSGVVSLYSDAPLTSTTFVIRQTISYIRTGSF